MTNNHRKQNKQMSNAILDLVDTDFKITIINILRNRRQGPLNIWVNGELDQRIEIYKLTSTVI